MWTKCIYQVWMKTNYFNLITQGEYKFKFEYNTVFLFCYDAYRITCMLKIVRRNTSLKVTSWFTCKKHDSNLLEQVKLKHNIKKLQHLLYLLICGKVSKTFHICLSGEFAVTGYISANVSDWKMRSYFLSVIWY